MNTATLPDGTVVPALGQGTWKMGDRGSDFKAEANALRSGMDLGRTLIDTAEMYADAELVVADAIQGRRDETFLVSKVLPSNASYRGTIKACENSLSRLQTECIDLYLLHWAGSYPVSETLEAFMKLVEQGKIARYGVSNFDAGEMDQAWSCTGGERIATNQVLYNLKRRGIEWSLVPWCERRNIPIMAYSPVNQGDLESSPFEQIAHKHGANHFQIALAWLLHQSNTIVIPKSSNLAHVQENFEASRIVLDEDDLTLLDTAFPPPDSETPLDVL